MNDSIVTIVNIVRYNIVWLCSIYVTDQCHNSSLRHRQNLLKFWLSLSSKIRQYPCSEPPPDYQDLSTCHDWPVENATVDLLVSLK